MNDAIRMQLSAFVDGELPDHETELLIRRISQDPVLRAQVAEYQAIGRVIRGDREIAGIDELLGRISDELGTPLEAVPEATAEPQRSGRLLRPVAGFAVAATVAMVAIFSLGQFGGEDPSVPVADGTYTVPNPEFSDLPVPTIDAATGFNTQVVTLQVNEEPVDDESEDEEQLAEEANDEGAELPAE